MKTPSVDNPAGGGTTTPKVESKPDNTASGAAKSAAEADAEATQALQDALKAIQDEENSKPNASNTVDEIKKYLDSKNVSYPANAKKDDLLELVKNVPFP
ncbi:hypothetical protein FP435_04535 [Lactobacillus sp. PV037]|uniref:HeH/LEM domain-containing protein n=1 Tax=Lactobacillus sp. PV037 TaxID=2594496 RepID=UPI002ACDAF21|nr:HeH/LEM domain-containing protein [Lactobacillus sp. PV037]QNQ84442.1 hypothetical protein FP435_04535 [Lactobacillus sp. PV037]